MLNMTATLTALLGGRKDFNRIRCFLVCIVLLHLDVRIPETLGQAFSLLTSATFVLRSSAETTRCRISAGVHSTRAALQSQWSLIELCWKPKREEAARDGTEVPPTEKT